MTGVPCRQITLRKLPTCSGLQGPPIIILEDGLYKGMDALSQQLKICLRYKTSPGGAYRASGALRITAYEHSLGPLKILPGTPQVGVIRIP